MANVTLANTSAQLSGKTVCVAENDQTISGAWTFTGNQLFNGNITLGNAVGDVVVITGTLASNLLFVDATYDIGASGATRPRDLFLSRNAVVGGTLAVTGAATLSSTLAVTGAVTGSARINSAQVSLADGATPALDASLGNTFLLVAAGNRTIAVPSNAVAGQKIVIRHDASGAARTLALNTGAGGFRFGTTITALTETASGKSDYIGCIYDSTDSFWDVVGYAKGL